jgi:hypothetical protein
MSQPKRGILRPYCLGLFAGYFVLFLVLHVEAMRFGAPSFLAQRSVGYLQIAQRFNPVMLLNASLGEWAARWEMLMVYVFMFIVYIRALQRVRSQPHHEYQLRSILGSMILFSLPLMALPYIMGQDIYSYISYGRLSAVYGANPTLVPPSAYPQDPFYQYLADWRHLLAPYGPVWLLFSHGLTLLVEQQGLWLHIIAYKLAALVFHLISSALIWFILGQWRPEQQHWGTLLYAWNPLALVEFAGSAHNDALLVCLILLAVWLQQRRRWRAAVVCLVAAVLVKWVVILLLPLYALLLIVQRHTWRARLSCAAQLAGIALASAIILYAPYWQGVEVLRPMLTNPVATRSLNSLGYVVVEEVPTVLYRLGRGPNPRSVPTDIPAEWLERMEMIRLYSRGGPYQPALARQLQLLETYETLSAEQDVLRGYVVAFSKIVALLSALVAAVAVWRRPTDRRYVQSSFWMLLMTLIFVPWFWPWYLSWPLALSALLAWRPAAQVMLTFTFTAPLVYLSPYRIVKLYPLLIFLPVLAVLGWHLWLMYRVGRHERADRALHPLAQQE